MRLYPVIILAGGLATRLRPITENIPKALVELAGKPFIAHQLCLLRYHGIKHIVISAWYRGEMIRDYLGDGRRFGMQVDYAFDGEKPLGTGGAIRQALGLLNGPFFVLYGDSYLPCNYVEIQAYFDHYSKPGLMTVYHNHGKWDASNVEMAGGQILAYDKKNRTPRMEFIDYGLGLFRPEAFANVVEGQPVDLAVIYQRLLSENDLLAYEVKQRFYEIGTFEGLRELDKLLSSAPDRFLRKECS